MDVFKRARLAYFVEIIMLPVLLYVYEPNSITFWLLLFLLDSFMVKRIDIVGWTRNMLEGNSVREGRQVMIMEGLFLVCLCIIAFISSSLAGILLLNDIIIDFMSYFQHMNEKKSD